MTVALHNFYEKHITLTISKFCAHPKVAMIVRGLATDISNLIAILTGFHHYVHMSSGCADQPRTINFMTARHRSAPTRATNERYKVSYRSHVYWKSQLYWLNNSVQRAAEREGTIWASVKSYKCGLKQLRALGCRLYYYPQSSFMP